MLLFVNWRSNKWGRRAGFVAFAFAIIFSLVMKVQGDSPPANISGDGNKTVNDGGSDSASGFQPFGIDFKVCVVLAIIATIGAIITCCFINNKAKQADLSGRTKPNVRGDGLSYEDF